MDLQVARFFRFVLAFLKDPSAVRIFLGLEGKRGGQREGQGVFGVSGSGGGGGRSRSSTIRGEECEEVGSDEVDERLKVFNVRN